ncbi:hypothetical protein CPB83DRAFT_197450 [Crepidotus variabilis]|uniref:Uncharacterized protein n=1 Tax=Crepidotus variabilis TaxID=179855 RepID=A0A9P6EHZ7_9AGAR|nr:hypothetical protein CPB83DRAFT_197450 [Crepidotus variabilis]
MPPVPQLIQRLDDATAVIPSNFEASLGPEVLAKIGPHTAQFKRISANINQSARAFNANDQEAYKNMVLEKAKVVHSNRSKKILDRETYVINMWMTVLSQNKEGLTVGQIWHTDMIKEHILTFLYYAVDAMKPLRGYGVLRSSSLGSVLYTLVSLVARYGHDPVTFTPRGHELLTNGGLYHNLQGQLFNIILTRKLDKTRRNPIFAGRDHGHLMIVTALVNSTKEPPRRLCAIQNILRLDMTFYATCRPSTLGYTEKRFRDAGAYIKLKDLTIYKKGYMEYEIKINLQYFKGALRTVHNDQQEITFKSVLYTHNILFDPVITFIAFLHLRGVFSKPYKTADELFDDPAAQLLIDSAELESPLFLKTKPGGKGLTDLAASADSHTTSTENLALAAGLPIMGPTAFRRDGGNKWSQQMGLGVAKDFLNHHEGPNVLGVHYHRRMNNFNPVGIRIGEEKGTNEAYAGEMIEVCLLVIGPSSRRLKISLERSPDASLQGEYYRIHSQIQGISNEGGENSTPTSTSQRNPD